MQRHILCNLSATVFRCKATGSRWALFLSEWVTKMDYPHLILLTLVNFLIFLFNKKKIKWKLAWWNLVRIVFPWGALAEKKYHTAILEDHRAPRTYSLLQKQGPLCFQHPFQHCGRIPPCPFFLLVTLCAPTWCSVAVFWGFFCFFCKVLFSPQTKQIRNHLTCFPQKDFHRKSFT